MRYTRSKLKYFVTINCLDLSKAKFKTISRHFSCSRALGVGRISNKHWEKTLSMVQIQTIIKVSKNRNDTMKYRFSQTWSTQFFNEFLFQVVYAGDSQADEFAISRLKGVAYTFRILNEDSAMVTKTAANYRLEGIIIYLIYLHLN